MIDAKDAVEMFMLKCMNTKISEHDLLREMNRLIDIYGGDAVKEAIKNFVEFYEHQKRVLW